MKTWYENAIHKILVKHITLTKQADKSKLENWSALKKKKAALKNKSIPDLLAALLKGMHNHGMYREKESTPPLYALPFSLAICLLVYLERACLTLTGEQADYPLQEILIPCMLTAVKYQSEETLFPDILFAQQNKNDLLANERAFLKLIEYNLSVSDHDMARVLATYCSASEIKTVTRELDNHKKNDWLFNPDLYASITPLTKFFSKEKSRLSSKSPEEKTPFHLTEVMRLPCTSIKIALMDELEGLLDQRYLTLEEKKENIACLILEIIEKISDLDELNEFLNSIKSTRYDFIRQHDYMLSKHPFAKFPSPPEVTIWDEVVDKFKNHALELAEDMEVIEQDTADLLSGLIHATHYAKTNKARTEALEDILDRKMAEPELMKKAK